MNREDPTRSSRLDPERFVVSEGRQRTDDPVVGLLGSSPGQRQRARTPYNRVFEPEAIPTGGRFVNTGDFLVFSSLTPPDRVRFLGSQLVGDPRHTTLAAASRCRLTPGAFRLRLQRWRRDGFALANEVWLNPQLFGVGLARAEVVVSDRASVLELFRDLRLVEGVLFAQEMVGEQHRSVEVLLVADTADAVVRRTSLLGRLAPGSQVRDPEPFWVPPCRVSLTPLDWRIVVAYREHPDAAPPTLARSLGLGPRTVSRHLNRLLDGEAIWWAIKHSFAHVPVVLVRAEFTDAASREAAEHILGEAFRNGWIKSHRPAFGCPSEHQPRVIHGMFHVPSPALAIRVTETIWGLPGVRNVTRRFPGSAVSYAGWFDARLSERLTVGGSSGSRWLPRWHASPMANATPNGPLLRGRSPALSISTGPCINSDNPNLRR